jgi:hypothetical protein
MLIGPRADIAQGSMLFGPCVNCEPRSRMLIGSYINSAPQSRMFIGP